jgi:predicted transcriptional regulator of viral defense system
MFQKFRKYFIEQNCFTVNQIRLVFPNFDVKNLTRWQNQAYILKLKNGLYTFPEHVDKPSIVLYFANRIYNPSYISLQYALNYYGVIPEFTPDITSISTLKTNRVTNSLGNFDYKHVKTSLFFGYEIKKADGFEVLFASIEKAIVDFFYLFPEYNNETEILNLRFDEEILKKSLRVKVLDQYAQKTENKQLIKRIQIMKKTYGL